MAVIGNYLLDTNIVIALFAGEQSVLDHLKVWQYQGSVTAKGQTDS